VFGGWGAFLVFGGVFSFLVFVLLGGGGGRCGGVGGRLVFGGGLGFFFPVSPPKCLCPQPVPLVFPPHPLCVAPFLLHTAPLFPETFSLPKFWNAPMIFCRGLVETLLLISLLEGSRVYSRTEVIVYLRALSGRDDLFG